jgi:hypothetical protein
MPMIGVRVNRTLEAMRRPGTTRYQKILRRLETWSTSNRQIQPPEEQEPQQKQLRHKELQQIYDSDGTVKNDDEP